MQCDIYNTSKKDLFVFVRQGTLPANILPPSLLAELGTLTHFKSKDLIEGVPLIGASSKDVIASINEHGYALQRAEVKTAVSEVGAAVGAGILAVSLGATLPITVAVSAAGFAAAYFFKEQEPQDD